MQINKNITSKKKALDLLKPNIMGILNVTPDSFSDGNQYNNIDSALYHVEHMIKDGADIIDIGGESTRPNADKVSLQEEIDRVLPIVEKIISNFDVIISVDTSKPEIMKLVLSKGVSIINDVRALRLDNAINVIAKYNPMVILMHMLAEPKIMQKVIIKENVYSNVVSDIRNYLKKRADACINAGISSKNIILDPGFGFGKSFEDNAHILNNLNEFSDLGYPLAVGLSRKSMISCALGEKYTVDKRLYPSIALAVMSVLNGAKIIRTHDVKATREACEIAHKVQEHD
tara:strand:- start:1962 stop:2822 length:861 start_codon:yes stop_codon:yes gene_type:complete